MKSIRSSTTATTLFIAFSILSFFSATLALPTPAAQIDIGPLISHQSLGCDQDFHTDNYKRWTKLDASHVLQKRQLGGPEWTAIQHLFKKDADANLSPRGVSDLKFQLAIRLMPRDQTLISRKLKELHDPEHKSFRKYLSREETMRLLS
jgi:hypothetical protein